MNKQALIQFFFPRKCMFCQEIIHDDICPFCQEQVQKYAFNTNKQILLGSATAFRHLSYCRSFYQYDGLIRDSILNAKFSSCSAFVTSFLKYLPPDLSQWIKNEKIDYIIAMPAHKTRFFEKEFYLPQEMAKEIAKMCEIAYNTELAVKVKKTKNQHNLSLEKRKNNLKEAFCVKTSVEGKNILIIDDVISTGYSLEEVAKTLKKQGASKVVGLTFAYNQM